MKLSWKKFIKLFFLFSIYFSFHWGHAFQYCAYFLNNSSVVITADFKAKKNTTIELGDIDQLIEHLPTNLEPISLRLVRLSKDRSNSGYLFTEDYISNALELRLDHIWMEFQRFSISDSSTLRTQSEFNDLEQLYFISILIVEIVRRVYLPQFYDQILRQFIKIHRFYNSSEFTTYLDGFEIERVVIPDVYKHFLIINLPETLPEPIEIDELSAPNLFMSKEVLLMLIASNYRKELDLTIQTLDLLRKSEYSILFFENSSFSNDPKREQTKQLIKIFTLANKLQNILKSRDIKRFSDADILNMKKHIIALQEFRASKIFKEFTSMSRSQKIKVNALKSVLGSKRSFNKMLSSLLLMYDESGEATYNNLLLWSDFLWKLNNELKIFDNIASIIDDEIKYRKISE